MRPVETRLQRLNIGETSVKHRLNIGGHALQVTGGIEKKGLLSKALYNFAFANQSWMMRFTGYRNPFWDIVVFSNVRASLGGRIR